MMLTSIKIYGLAAVSYGLIGILEILNVPQTYLPIPPVVKIVIGILFFIPFAISLSRFGLNSDDFESFSEEARIRWRALTKANFAASTVLPGTIIQSIGLSVWVVVNCKPPFDLNLTLVASATFSTWSGIWFLFIYDDACRLFDTFEEEKG